jgi:hypothetical protein
MSDASASPTFFESEPVDSSAAEATTTENAESTAVEQQDEQAEESDESVFVAAKKKTKRRKKARCDLMDLEAECVDDEVANEEDEAAAASDAMARVERAQAEKAKVDAEMRRLRRVKKEAESQLYEAEQAKKDADFIAPEDDVLDEEEERSGARHLTSVLNRFDDDKAVSLVKKKSKTLQHLESNNKNKKKRRVEEEEEQNDEDEDEEDDDEEEDDDDQDEEDEEDDEEEDDEDESEEELKKTSKPASKKTSKAPASIAPLRAVLQEVTSSQPPRKPTAAAAAQPAAARGKTVLLDPADAAELERKRNAGVMNLKKLKSLVTLKKGDRLRIGHNVWRVTCMGTRINFTDRLKPEDVKIGPECFTTMYNETKPLLEQDGEETMPNYDVFIVSSVEGVNPERVTKTMATTVLANQKRENKEAFEQYINGMCKHKNLQLDPSRDAARMFVPRSNYKDLVKKFDEKFKKAAAAAPAASTSAAAVVAPAVTSASAASSSTDSATPAKTSGSAAGAAAAASVHRRSSFLGDNKCVYDVFAPAIRAGAKEMGAGPYKSYILSMQKRLQSCAERAKLSEHKDNPSAAFDFAEKCIGPHVNDVAFLLPLIDDNYRMIAEEAFAASAEEENASAAAAAVPTATLKPIAPATGGNVQWRCQTCPRLNPPSASVCVTCKQPPARKQSTGGAATTTTAAAVDLIKQVSRKASDEAVRAYDNKDNIEKFTTTNVSEFVDL